MLADVWRPHRASMGCVNQRGFGIPMQHDNPVWRAESSPDRARVVAASADIFSQVVDAVVGAPSGVSDSVYDAEFSPNGEWVVTASTDGTARIWDAATGNPDNQPDAAQRGGGRHLLQPDGAGW